MAKRVIGITLAFAGGVLFYPGITAHPVNWGLMGAGWGIFFVGAVINGRTK